MVGKRAKGAPFCRKKSKIEKINKSDFFAYLPIYLNKKSPKSRTWISPKRILIYR